MGRIAGIRLGDAEERAFGERALLGIPEWVASEAADHRIVACGWRAHVPSLGLSLHAGDFIVPDGAGGWMADFSVTLVRRDGSDAAFDHCEQGDFAGALANFLRGGMDIGKTADLPCDIVWDDPGQEEKS